MQSKGKEKREKGKRKKEKGKNWLHFFTFYFLLLTFGMAQI